MIERLISFVSRQPSGGEHGLHYGCVAIGAGERAAAWIGTAEGGTALSDAPIERGEGTLRVGPEIVLALVARTGPLSFETGSDRRVDAQAIGVSAELGSGKGFEGEGVSWTLHGEGDQAAARTLWASLGERGLLLAFALRAAAAQGHGEETVGAVRISREGSVTAYEEPLISTEYDAAGQATRATLELWGGEEEGFAERGGGLRRCGGEAELAEARLSAAGFEWRIDGHPAVGGYEIITT